MKKALLAALLAGGVSVGNAVELEKLLAACEGSKYTSEEVANCQRVLTSLWFQANAMPSARAPAYTPSYRPDTKCTAVQNVFGNWDMRCY